MRPAWSQLERPGNAARVWRASRQRFASKVVGPHFEQICRAWALNHVDPDRLGGLPGDVSGTRLACFSGAGFTDELHNLAAEDDQILLVSPADLYS
jgi:hypothetical protein